MGLLFTIECHLGLVENKFYDEIRQHSHGYRPLQTYHCMIILLQLNILRRLILGYIEARLAHSSHEIGKIENTHGKEAVAAHIK